MDEETLIPDQIEKTGYLNIQTELKTEILVSAGKQALGLEEILDDMSVQIWANPNTFTPSLVTLGNYRDLPPLIELPSSGEYFIIMTSGPVAFDIGSFDSRFDKGAYGFQTEFTAAPGSTTTINATLQLLDIAVSINYTDEVLANYPDIQAEIHVMGDFNTPSLSWFAIDDTRTGYFGRTYSSGALAYDYLLSEGGSLVVNITAQSNSGTEILVTKTYENASPNEHYMITVSYAASGAGISVTLGDEIIIEDEIPFPG